MVAKAKAGVYQDYAFKTTPEAIRKKYFYPVDGGLKVMESVASLTSFQQMNLNDAVGAQAHPQVPRGLLPQCHHLFRRRP